MGCREPFAKLAIATDRSHAEQLFGSLGARVTDPFREPKFDSARIKIANAALLPSRVWDDTSVWTSSTPGRRTLSIAGRLVGGRYRLEASRSATFPAQPAESRHIINLTRLSGDAFAWDTEVAHGIGSVTAPEAGAFVTALFASGEGRQERDVRSDYRAVVPKASAVLGLLFRVDSIRTSSLADRSTLATFDVTMTPAGVASRYPNFAQYMSRYAETARMHWTLTDRTAATFLDCALSEGRIRLRVRTLNGSMVSLAGPARPMPDSLTLNGDLTMKVRRFTVGFKNYHADFTFVRTDHDRAWSIVSRREPEWILPLVTERLLRTPLRRPFQGSGALFRIGVHDSSGAQTILQRRMHLDVQESALLRFVGRLGSTAVSDFTGRAEREQYAWLREFFNALVADVRGASF